MASKILKNDEDIEFIIQERFLESDKFAVYKGTYVSKDYLKYSKLIEHFEVRDDDIWLCDFPRAGIKKSKLYYVTILQNLLKI